MQVNTTRPHSESGELYPSNLMNDIYHKDLQVTICSFCDIPSIKSMCVNRYFYEIINDSRYRIWQAVGKVLGQSCSNNEEAQKCLSRIAKVINKNIISYMNEISFVLKTGLQQLCNSENSDDINQSVQSVRMMDRLKILRGFLSEIQVQGPHLQLDTLENFIDGKLKFEEWCAENSTNLDTISTLSLDNKLLTFFPPEMRYLTLLQELHLHDNYLSILPSEISCLTQLTFLDLGTNNLTTLPRELGCLTQLKHLDLGQNKLRELPSEIGALTNLVRLFLDNNQLIRLPQEIGGLTNLRSLSLQENKLTALPKIYGLTQLEYFSIQNNALTKLPLMYIISSSTKMAYYNNPITWEQKAVLNQDAVLSCISIIKLTDKYLIPALRQINFYAGKVLGV